MTGLFVPITASMDCVFLNKLTKRCEVYNDRPNVCRLQGTIPELPCPKVKGENYAACLDYKNEIGKLCG